MLIPPSEDVLDRYPVLVFEEVHSDAPLQKVKSAPKELCASARICYIKHWHVVHPSSAQLYATTDAHKASFHLNSLVASFLFPSSLLDFLNGPPSFHLI